MTGSLIEAFHVAAIQFAHWHHHNNQIDEGFVIYEGVSQTEFLPEPTVGFFGQEHRISAICERAKILQGPMPLPLTMLFRLLLDNQHHWESDFDTFGDAVECLGDLIKMELERERRNPPLRVSLWQNAQNELIDAFEARLKEASS